MSLSITNDSTHRLIPDSEYSNDEMTIMINKINIHTLYIHTGIELHCIIRHITKQTKNCKEFSVAEKKSLKLKNFHKKSDIFIMFAQNIDCGDTHQQVPTI